mmetsp:Transcript_104817/g.302388  ORF Transcript_104817/g.302388 Transcript_104817/m.302388 type:complete len:552 (+) Transcript_104817:98-1753(+)
MIGGVCFKFWPDLQAYYAFLYVLVLVSLAARVSDNLRIRLSTRLVMFGGCTTGEVAVTLLFLMLMIFEVFYWMYLRPVWNDTYPQDTLNDWERVGRTAAQLLNCVMGLLILPVSRNSLWSISLGIGWEAMIKWHTWMGDLFLVLIMVHAGSFCKVYADDGLDWWTNLWWNTGYDKDNWTITLQVYVVTIFLFTHGVLTLNYIRRHYFEVFYYAHHTFLALWISTLWHANSSWYYMIGGLSLWMLDRTLRTLQAYSRVEVQTLACIDKEGFLPTITSKKASEDSDTSVTSVSDKIVYLAYTLESGGLNGTHTNGSRTKMDIVAGQYAFINVPAISIHEWHPFTISSAPADGHTTHHIKAMAPGSFTDRLHGLVSTHPNPRDLEVHVEGPFGVGVETKHYDQIVLVAGGIGITPCHALLRDLVQKHKAGPGSSALSQLRSVTLIWTARYPSLFNMFEPTFKEAIELSEANKGTGQGFEFNLSLWLTDQKMRAQVLTSQEYSMGRPNLKSLLEPASASGMRSLVFHCGPTGLEEASRAAALELGLDFHTETFAL